MIQHYTVYNVSALEIVGNMEVSPSDVAANTPEGCAVLEGAYSSFDAYVVDGVPALYTEPQRALKAATPKSVRRWSNASMEWVDTRTMEQRRADRWNLVKQWRTQAEFSTFIWDGSVFDADEKSAARIAGAFALALASQMAAVPYSQVWTLADNTTRELSAADMVAVGVALGAHVAWTHNRGRELRVRIEDPAATAEEIEAVVW